MEELDFVKHFGARPRRFNGNTPLEDEDNVTAFAAMIDHLGTTGGGVFIPPGDYRMSAKNVIDVPTRIRTLGPAHTRFLYANSGGLRIASGGSQSAITGGLTLAFTGIAALSMSECQQRAVHAAHPLDGRTGFAPPLWRPSINTVAGAFVVPAVTSNWTALLATNTHPNFGWAYRADTVNGSVKCAVTSLDHATGTFTVASHTFVDLQPVRLSASMVMPTGSAQSTNYWIRDATPTSFRLSATSGGAALTFGSAGTGVLTVSPRGVTGAVEPTGWKTQNPRAGGGAVLDSRTFTVNTGTHVCTASAAHGWSNGQCVRLGTAGAFPGVVSGTALAVYTSYFVGNVSGADFKLYRDAALATQVSFTSAGSGTHTVYRYDNIDLTPIADGDVLWTPVLLNGLEVSGSHVVLDEVQCTGFPSNAFYWNTSTQYAHDPSVIDGLPDYGNASRYTAHRCIGSYNGGTAWLAFGYDVSNGFNYGFDAHYNQGFGIFSGASFTNTYDTCHADTNVAGNYWGHSGEFRNCYIEGNRSLPVIKAGARWTGGATPGFCGLPATWTEFTKKTTWAAATAYIVGDIVRPTVDMGWWFLCIGAGTSGASEPTWKPCMDHGLNDYRNSVTVYTDTYQSVSDNGVTWRAFLSSEVSTGAIELSGINTSAARTFLNRTSGERFHAGGNQNGAAFAWQAPIDLDDSIYEVVWNDAVKAMRWQKNGTDFQSFMEITGDGHVLGDAKVIMRRGLFISDENAGTPGQLIFVDAVPTNGSHTTGCVAIHRDAASGQPFMWHREAGGTWTVILNKP